MFLAQFVTASVLLAACAMESAPALRQEPAGGVEHMGDYAELRESEGHLYGYTLQLWKDGTQVVGLWSRAAGEPADFPTVRLTDLKWDATGGNVEFTVVWCGTSQRFKGVTSKAEISGQLTDDRTGKVTTVRLQLTADEWPSLSRSDWLFQTEEILRTRRPRC